MEQALEVNALSTWKLLCICEQLARRGLGPQDVWINTSEAEVQPAVSPGYEISKRLIGQLVSIRGAVPVPTRCRGSCKRRDAAWPAVGGGPRRSGKRARHENVVDATTENGTAALHTAARGA